MREGDTAMLVLAYLNLAASGSRNHGAKVKYQSLMRKTVIKIVLKLYSTVLPVQHDVVSKCSALAPLGTVHTYIE